jgi:Tol biopolymer transport system component
LRTIKKRLGIRRFRSLQALLLTWILFGTCAAFASEQQLPPVVLTELTGPYLGQQPPGRTPRVFAPGIISTGVEHSAAMFTPDGTEVWFGRMYPAAIYFMELRDEVWTAPRPAPFCTEHGELYPYLSMDGRRLYFTTTRPIAAGAKSGSRGTGQIWCAERAGDGWNAPYHLGQQINRGARQACGSVAADGTMYFGSSPGADGRRSPDLFMAEPQNDGFADAVYLGSTLCSDSPEFSPCIAPDESFIVYSSFRGGFGRSDLFVSFRDGAGGWGRPVNLGSAINSPFKDEYPYLSSDGKYLFFNSNRPSEMNEGPIPDGPGNVYWVDAAIIEEFKP